MNILKKIVNRGISDMYIVYMDGGLCSQMQQYMVGKYLAGKGYKVKYDITWYEKYRGVGVNSRKFELLNLFGELEIEIATKKEVQYYKKNYFFKTTCEGALNQWGNLTEIPAPPQYVGGYYNLGVESYKLFKEIFKISVDNLYIQESIKDIYRKIKGDIGSVGVHVRRGDMSKEGGYWTVVSPQYFINAMEMYDINISTFYFFSDEVDWIEEHILPKLKKNIRYEVVSSNNAGWVDFMLLSACNNFIGSQGSMSKFAFFINEGNERKLVLPEEKKSTYWKRISDNFNISMIEG